MHSGLELTLLLLGCAVLGVVAFRMLQLPPMLGYLAVGVLIGPHALALADDSPATHTLAEFGVVFLMFSIGLEFSLAQLKSMRRIVFGLGLAQVVLTIVAAMGFGLFISWWAPTLHVSWQAAFALGGALAMSSTAIVVKMLTERLELESEHGRRIIGILLFQDLAVVPLLIMIPSLSRPAEDLAVTLGWAALKAAAVLALLLFFGQKLMRKWFTVVVKRRSQELFMLNLLLVTLGLAWVTEQAGLSLALGAFVAGMLISETQYKHQVEEDIKPFRDVLLGLFFITVGMLLNVGLVLQHWWVVLALVIFPVLLKFAIIALLAKAFGSSDGVAMRTGLALAQAGEFGFVLLNLAMGSKLVDPFLIQLVLASMVLSMLLAPFMIENMDRIVMKVAANEWMMQSLQLTQLASRTMKTQKHVIVAGFGRSGQSLANLLSEEKLPWYALDLDPERVQEAQSAGANVSYGDAARRESLIAAGIHRASALVITFADTRLALKVLHLVHELAPNLAVIVRSHDDRDLDVLKKAGATEVVPEALESSLMLASHALVTMGVPLRRVVHRVQAARDERYASLRGYFHGASDVSDDPEHAHVRLHSVTLREGAAAIGRALGELALGDTGAEVTTLRRGGQSLSFDPATLLLAGDVLVLRGVGEAVDRAESRLS
ncbi:monovalent cation:proton antiporter-2 (CPA2) family protein [Massilia sp. MS-15]|uniref:monovalent cation:proton antiporter-2 (CPA2) family protein n=1 Tax=Massilia sp. MS-15 TaxID=2878200 RepID=UPI001CD4BF37|nr:monovalent cation:proton antiporter-2 (CPA2) family protein [Massilia sp. MS-15]MCA1247457.1 monovalent cation:proton antiporter-2 (CPA2) family protein [Massilia sp. MS-15]